VDDFLRVYRGGKKDAAAVVLDNSLVAMALGVFMTHRDSWTGNTKELLVLLGGINVEYAKDKSWPKTVQALTNEFQRLKPSLQSVSGLVITSAKRVGKDRKRAMTIRNVACKPSSATSATSAGSTYSGDNPF